MQILGHFRTITRHRHVVFRHCVKAGIVWQGLTHDLSKYTPTEFIPGAKYYAGGRRSPNENERKLFGYSKAWLHHKGRNRHHFEYWTDYNPAKHQVEPVEMPMRYVAELICDRVAASKIYRKDEYTERHPLDYFLGGKANRMIHPATSDYIESMLTLLAERGEDVMFAKLKRDVRRAKKGNSHVR